MIAIKGIIKSSDFSVKDVHDSNWEYEFIYSYNGQEYTGVTSQYIHWAPPFIIKYFDNLLENGGVFHLRIDGNNPSIYDANMDYSVAMEYGLAYDFSAEDEVNKTIDINDKLSFMLKTTRSADHDEIKVIGYIYDEERLTKALFGLLANGSIKILFDLKECIESSITISGAVGWAARYLNAFSDVGKIVSLFDENEVKDYNMNGSSIGIVGHNKEKLLEKLRKEVIPKKKPKQLTEEETEKQAIAYIKYTLKKSPELILRAQKYSDDMFRQELVFGIETQKELEAKNPLTVEEKDILIKIKESNESLESSMRELDIRMKNRYKELLEEELTEEEIKIAEEMEKKYFRSSRDEEEE